MLATEMWTHVLISFDENVENNLICSPQEKSKKSQDLSAGDQVATENVCNPGFVTGHYEHLCQFLWMEMRKSLNFSPGDQSRKSLDLLSRLNEQLYQDLLIKLLLRLSICWRGGRFFKPLSSPQPCSAAIFKIVT